MSCIPVEPAPHTDLRYVPAISQFDNVFWTRVTPARPEENPHTTHFKVYRTQYDDPLRHCAQRTDALAAGDIAAEGGGFRSGHMVSGFGRQVQLSPPA